jgi:cardiolipin synthase
VVFPWLTSKINYRNHRKIVVVDGEVGFTGGVNIARRYLTGTRLGVWRDTHLRIEGEAVASLNAVFVRDWHFARGEWLGDDERYFPAAVVDIETPVQIASSGPDSDWASIMQAYFAAINKSRKSIYITSPYFLPNQAILTALKVAALSGIDVRIILPNHSDTRIAHWASRSYISELLDAGIKVYFYCNGFNHSKLLIIDNEFCSVGSANMDYRSFEDNFEVSAVMYDPRIAATLTQHFMQDIQDSVLTTREAWDNRSNLHAAYESLARLFSPLL